MGDPDLVIDCEDLTRSFPSGLALDALTLDVKRGEVLALLGPNGAGKTTTMRLLNGVLRADSGRATVLGLDPWTQGEALRRRTGVLTENAGLMSPYPPGLELPELKTRKSCLDMWPAVYAADDAKPIGKWSIVTRTDGRKQWAYDGFALYTSNLDRQIGDVIGGSSVNPRGPDNTLAGDAEGIRVISTEALPIDNRLSIKQTEWTYGLMMHMSGALGVNCTFCHNTHSFQAWDGPPQRVTGTAVFLSAEKGSTPFALLHNLKHNKVLHEQNLFVTVQHHEVPWIGFDKRCQIEPLGHDCWQVTLHFGFKNEPDVPEALKLLEGRGVNLDEMETSYFLSRDTVIPTFGGGMAMWREKLFASMHRNAAAAADFLNLPANRIVELGAKVQI